MQAQLLVNCALFVEAIQNKGFKNIIKITEIAPNFANYIKLHFRKTPEFLLCYRAFHCSLFTLLFWDSSFFPHTKMASQKGQLGMISLWNSCHVQELVYQRPLRPLFKMNNALEFLYH